jgi:uncharacterized protein (TIGR02594 family)
VTVRGFAFASALLGALAASSPAPAADILEELFGVQEARLPRHDTRWRKVRDRPLRADESAPLLAAAQRFLGAGKVTRLPGPWCRDFVNLVAERAGYRLANNSRRAIDALRLGAHVRDPRPGDLAVMRNHVTIVAGRDRGKIIGLGGNQSRRVRYSAYPERRVLAFVRL